MSQAFVFRHGPLVPLLSNGKPPSANVGVGRVLHPFHAQLGKLSMHVRGQLLHPQMLPPILKWIVKILHVEHFHRVPGTRTEAIVAKNELRAADARGTLFGAGSSVRGMSPHKN